MDLKNIFEKINFTDKYRKICYNSVKFEDMMVGNNKKLYQEILDAFNYKYISNGSFYQIIDKKFTLQFK